MNTTQIAQDLLDQVAAGQKKIARADKRETNLLRERIKRDRVLAGHMRGNVAPRQGKSSAGQKRTDGQDQHGECRTLSKAEIMAIYG